MAHITFVVPRFHTNLFHPTQALIAAGHRVSLLVNKAGDNEDHRHVAPQVLGLQPEPGAVEAALASLRPDIVFIRTAHDLSRQAARAARKLGLRALRYDLMPMGEAVSAKQRLLHWWRGLPRGRITPVAALNPHARRDPQAHYMPWPVARSRDLVVGEDVLRAKPVPVLCVGKFGNPRKNHLALIEALSALGGGDVVHLTLVGSLQRTDVADGAAYFERLQEVVAQNSWIEMRIEVPYPEMAQVYADHALCVLPSFDEPLGISPIEGMAYGTIPVISEQSGSAGYVTHGVDGLRMDMTQDGALERVLAPVLRDTEMRMALSRAARLTAEAELSPARFVARMEALIAGDAGRR